jgi:hypothetical protein
MGAADLYGAKTNAETLCDDLIGLGFRNKIEDLPFTGRQRRGASRQFTDRRCFEVVLILPVERALNAVEECLLLYQLFGEIERPGAQCGDRGRRTTAPSASVVGPDPMIACTRPEEYPRGALIFMAQPLWAASIGVKRWTTTLGITR